ncbi:MAG: VOC family protein [Gemmatimonadaceae bacterium]
MLQHTISVHDSDAGSRGIQPRGYNLPDATRLGRVRLQVADLARSLSFYEDVLGFRVLDRAVGGATLGAHEDDTPLIELQALPGAAPVPRSGRLGLYHFALLLPDRAALGRFLRHLAEIGYDAGASDHSVSEALYLRDPDGLGIEVYADRPMEAWRYDGRQLLMDTKPLDAQNLARAANGQPWTGMPAGTSVGHVHLHVGDIDRAVAFFHAALGLDAVVWSYPGALFLSAGGYHHHLGVNTWAGANARSPGAGDAQLLQWEIIVPDRADAERAARSMEDAGHRVVRDDRGWLVEDPWGTTLRMVSLDV